MIKLPLTIHERGNETGFYVEDANGRSIFDDGSAYGEYSEQCSLEDAQIIVEAMNKSSDIKGIER